ncbi:amidase signature enzyme [Cylindrobasidium torrendii FP15055 ss-10]|uniref:Glutamyl-tRNA(Gln) amidotransferase subunit A, mitochondrial n=1 Tax=Cylindrobasidium torrendii FP15055 ss-10 TaxID=1314674 RepID=A0A0D7AZ25_9AGAR|nr:amidase signature enzyme [Cylindrobasidium torrendii FP15055 ss-10]
MKPRCSRQLVHNIRHRTLNTASITKDPFNAFEDALIPIQNARPGALSDLSIGVKANIATTSFKTTASSNALRDYVSPMNATVVELLEDAGAQVIGKTNCDEFGMGSLNTNSIHGPVVNPFRPEEQRSAGGSSGGSAAAVAAGLCDAALGTDTGGSVRLPASYCGVVGLKPSYGLLSRWGVVPYADSLDTVGIFAKTVATTRRLFDTLNVHDPRDPTSVSSDARTSSPRNHSTTLRIGIPQECFPRELSNTVTESTRNALANLKAQGAELVPVSLKSLSFSLSAYYVLASAEASSNLARYDGMQYGLKVSPPASADLSDPKAIYAYSRTQGFGSEVTRRILLGAYSLSAEAFDNYFLQAQRVRQHVKNDFDNAFKEVDVLVHPSAIRTAPRLGEPQVGLESYVQDVLTVPASLAGIPAMSVPVSHSEEDGWPIGVSVVGKWGSDALVMKVGEMLER